MYQYKSVKDLEQISSDLNPNLIVCRQYELEPSRSIYLISRYSNVQKLAADYSEYRHDVCEFGEINLENGPECLPKVLREIFYHINFKYRTFNTFHADVDLVVLMRYFETILIKLEDCKISNDALIDIARILQIYTTNARLNYTIDTMFGPVPWNDTILPILSMPLPGNTIINYTNPRPKIAATPVLPEMDIDKIYTRDRLMEIIKTYTTGGVGTDRISDDTLTRFIKHTKNISPALNGTACVGKSTILRDITSHAQRTLNCPVEVLKLSQYGGFRDKDVNDLVGMQCLPVLLHACEENPTSVTDRCVFNNVIWKLIMSLFDAESDQELIERAYKSLRTLNLNLLEYMKKFPIFVLVDSAITLNRKRMFKRGVETLTSTDKVTGDLYRCKIVPYVKAQNVIYGTLATICDWPVIDVGFKFPLPAEWTNIITNTFCTKLQENKQSKASPSDAYEDAILQNKMRNGRVVYRYRHSEYPMLDYLAAKAMKVFK